MTVTRTLLDHRAEALNARLRDGLRVDVQGRNGGFGLDLCDPHGVVRMLTFGTKREVYAYLGAMHAALDIVNR